MTPERFAELTQIYGAEPRRWPEAERAAARAFSASQPDEAAAALQAAAFLDDELDGYRVAAPSADLRARIVATAPRGVWRRSRLWWQGAGFAGLGLAGALAGALVVGVVLPLHMQADDDEGAYAITAFSEFSEGMDE